ncbi:MAG: TolC family protein [Gemmatimonadota bacterium]|nr:MAG: TolC family protein [Gemmatimonadota bacterium]
MQARIIIIGFGLVALARMAMPDRAAAQAQSVTLDQAVGMALQAQPAMVQARGQVTSAGAAKLQTVGSWLPNVSLSSGASTNSSTRYDQATQRTVSASSTSYSAGISASLVVFDGLGRLYDGRAASADARAADASLVNQRFQTTLQTKQAFFNALAAEELVRVSETRIERAMEQLKVAQEKLAAGTATRSDTLRSTVEVANARLQKLNAETQLATAEANLARLIGVGGRVRAVREDRLLVISEIDTMTVREEALSQSPAIYQADAQAAAAAAQYSASFGQYLPQVTASYSRSWSGSEFTELDPSWSVRLSASWPLFNGFSRELNRTRSAVNRDNARAQAEDARRQVNAQLTQDLASLMSAQTRLEIALANRAASEEDLRVQQERYRLGAATILDVLASQVNLDQAEVDIVQARLDYLVAKAQIEALIGREL